MKKLVFLIFLISIFDLVSQESSLPWPILNSEQNVIMGFGDYYSRMDHASRQYKQSNGYYFISDYGSEVVAIGNGIIESIHPFVYLDPANVTMRFFANSLALDDFLAENPEYDKEHFFGAINILLDSGEEATYLGMSSITTLLPGEQVFTGQVLGQSGYIRTQFTNPVLYLEVRDRGVAVDFGPRMGIFSGREMSNDQIPVASDRISFESMNTDLHSLLVAIESFHTSPFENNFRENWIKEVESFLAIKKTGADIVSFYFFIRDLLIKMYDCHISISPPPGFSHNFFPFYVSYVDQSLFVWDPVNSDALGIGDEILSINGISAEAIISSLKSHHIRDGYQEVNLQFPLAVDSPRILSDLFRNPEEWTITTEYIESLELESLSVPPRLGRASNSALTIRNISQIYDNYYYSPVNENTHYLYIKHFDLFERELVEIDQYINEIMSEEKMNLIVDLRFNPGGDENNLFRLMEIIYGFKPVIPRLRIRNQMTQADYLSMGILNVDTFLRSPIANKEYDFYFTNLDDLPRNNTQHQYNVIILQNGSTYSAASIFSFLSQAYGWGTIVGTTSGGSGSVLNAEPFGRLRLPESGLFISIPLERHFFGFPFGSSLSGVSVDNEITLDLEDIIDGNADPIIEELLQILEN